MTKRALTELYAIKEDGVARRALADIITKAKDSGRLSASESEWADQLTQSVKSSTGDSMRFPKLSLSANRGADASKQDGSGLPHAAKSSPNGAEPVDAGPSSDATDFGPAGGPGPKKVPTGVSLSKKSGRKVPSTNRFAQAADAENDVGDLGPAGGTGNPSSPPTKKSSIPPASPQKMAFDTSDIKDGPGTSSLPVKKPGKLSRFLKATSWNPTIGKKKKA